MTTESVERMLIRIDATTEQLRREMKRGDAATNKFSRSISQKLERINRAFAKARKKANAWSLGMATAGAAATTALVKSGLSSVDSLAKTSDKLGIATDALARYRFAAQQTGVDQKKADVALQRFTRRLADAAAGTGPAVKAFDALGLEASELINLAPDQAFAKVADQMNKVENQSQKVSLAFKLFDSEGVGLVNTLALGSEGLDKLGQQADAAGLSISRIDAAKVEAANDAMARVRSAVSGLGQQLAVQFAPLLKAVADRIFGISQESGGMAKAAGKAFNFMVKAAGIFGNSIRVLQLGWNGMKMLFQQAAKSIVKGFKWLSDSAIDLYNSLPWVDDVEYTKAFSGFLATMESEIAESKAKVDELLRRPLPSESIQDFVAESHRQFEAQAIVVAETQDQIKNDLITTGEVTDKLSSDTKDATDEMAKAWQESRSLLSQFFTDMASDGKGAFDTLLDGFKGLLSKMTAEAATTKIFDQVKNVVAGGGGGFAGNLLSSLGVPGGDLAALFKNSGGFESVAAGGAGAMAGNAVFGEQSGIGAGLGGIAGAIVGGPIGAAIGSFIGTGLEKGLGKVFGFGQNNGDNTGYTSFNLASGSRNSAGVGKSFNQDNVDASGAFVDALTAFSAAIGGSNFSGRVNIGNRTGISFEGYGAAGQFGQNKDEALAFAFREIVKEATNLEEALKPMILAFRGTGEEIALFATAVTSLSDSSKINVATRAIEDFSRAQPTALEAYDNQIVRINRMIDELDGSAEAYNELATVVGQNKTAAYDFAIAIQQIGQQMGIVTADQAQYIRQSVLTAEQLRAARLAERDALSQALSTFTDPEKASETFQRIAELNRQVFDSLDKPSSDDAERFAGFIESEYTKLQSIIDQAVAGVSASETDLNARIGDILAQTAQRNQEVAELNMSAAEMNHNSAESFAAWVNNLVNNGINIEVNRAGELI